MRIRHSLNRRKRGLSAAKDAKQPAWIARDGQGTSLTRAEGRARRLSARLEAAPYRLSAHPDSAAAANARAQALRQLKDHSARQSIAFLQCDAKIYHMAKASVRDLRYRFHEVEDLLRQGQEIQITKRRRVIARLVPEKDEKVPEVPDFLARLKRIYGKPLKVTGAEIVSRDREDRF